MIGRINNHLDELTFKRIDETITSLERYEWFRVLPDERKFMVAVQFTNMRRSGLQTYKILVSDNIPILLSVMAVIFSLMT